MVVFSLKVRDCVDAVIIVFYNTQSIFLGALTDTTEEKIGFWL